MPATPAQLDDFHQFALDRLKQTGGTLEFDELVMEWCELHDRDAIIAAIEQGLAEVDAGLGRDADEVNAELSRKFGLLDE